MLAAYHLWLCFTSLFILGPRMKEQLPSLILKQKEKNSGQPLQWQTSLLFTFHWPVQIPWPSPISVL